MFLNERNKNFNKIISININFLIKIIVVLVFSCTISNKVSYSQNISKTNIEKEHSPHKATIYSALIPGLGQIYNKQYWKVPVLYAGIVTIVYFVNFNGDKYYSYKDEYVARINADSSKLNPSYILYSDNSILQLKNYYQRNLEFTWIMAGVVYLLNIIDASVYAHLFNFDVNENLSLKIEPLLFNENYKVLAPPQTGLKLVLRIK